VRAAMTPAVIFDLLQRVPLFSALPAIDLQAAAAGARSISRKKGARIFEENSPADSCYVLVTGRAKVVISGDAGVDITLGLVGPFELLGELALLDNSTRSAGLIALDDCQLIQIGRAAFLALRNNRQFEDKLVAHVTAILRRATEQLRVIYSYSSADRLSWCLARLASSNGERRGRALVISPRPTHQELADMTGCSRETVTRMLLKLKRENAIAWTDDDLLVDEHAFKRFLDIERSLRCPVQPLYAM
jgi:CRP/FNR family cyclic AMP-dependent transcriptional regulator